MNNHIWFDATGWTGAAFLLVAYAMVSSKKLEADSTAYQLLNIIGSLSFVPITRMLQSRSFISSFPAAAASATRMGQLKWDRATHFCFSQVKRTSFGMRAMRTLFIT